jgi:hypothetical protein
VAAHSVTAAHQEEMTAASTKMKSSKRCQMFTLIHKITPDIPCRQGTPGDSA